MGHRIPKTFCGGAEYDVILETPIGDPELRDRLVWPFVKNGCYSVKSRWTLPHGLGGNLNIRIDKMEVVWFGGESEHKDRQDRHYHMGKLVEGIIYFKPIGQRMISVRYYHILLFPAGIYG